MANAQSFAEKSNEDYDMHLKHAKDAAADAEKTKTPGFYRVSFHQLVRLEWMVTILVAFNVDKDETAVKCSKEIDGLQVEYKKKEAALIKATARVVVDPVDKCTGGDKETHRKAILSAWKKAHPTEDQPELSVEQCHLHVATHRSVVLGRLGGDSEICQDGHDLPGVCEQRESHR